MHVLMTGQLAGKKEDYAELQPEENKFIRNAIAEGLVRNIFVKTDQTGIVMILSDVTADEARENGEPPIHRPRRRHVRIHRNRRPASRGT